LLRRHAPLSFADWTFEASQPTTAGPFIAEAGLNAATSQALGSHAGAAVYSTPAGNGSSHSFSSNTWAVNDYWQFTTSTTGFTNIAIAWDQTSSNTGPGDFEIQYSTDGTNFTGIPIGLLPDYSVLANGSPNPAWNSTTSSGSYGFSRNLSTVSDLNNAASIFIRLVDHSTVSANGGTVAAAGTDRVDNFTISGSAVPEMPTLLVWLMLGGSVIASRKPLQRLLLMGRSIHPALQPSELP
jgi:hypothetical protein